MKNLTKKTHFPITRAVPNPIKGWKKLFSFLSYRRKWEIIEDYFIWSKLLNSWIFIPKGFIYDGASIPKLFYMIFSPMGILLLGAGPHDFGYRYKGLFTANGKGYISFKPGSKFELDRIFNSLCAQENKLPVGTGIATLILFIAGYIGWVENRYRNKDVKKDFKEMFI